MGISTYLDHIQLTRSNKTVSFLGGLLETDEMVKEIPGDFIMGFEPHERQLELTAGEVTSGEFTIKVSLGTKDTIALSKWLHDEEGGILYDFGEDTVIECVLYMKFYDTAIIFDKGVVVSWNYSFDEQLMSLTFHTGLSRLKFWDDLTFLMDGDDTYKYRPVAWILDRIKTTIDCELLADPVHLTADSPFFSYCEHPEARYCEDVPPWQTEIDTPTAMVSYLYYYGGILYVIAGKHLIGYDCAEKEWHWYANIIYLVNQQTHPGVPPPFPYTTTWYGFKVLGINYNVSTSKLDILIVQNASRQFGQSENQSISWDMQVVSVAI